MKRLDIVRNSQWYHEMKMVKSQFDSSIKIYRIMDDNNTVFYIGSTKNEIYHRVLLHCTTNESFPVYNKIWSLLSENRSIKADIIYEFKDNDNARLVEKFIINFCHNFLCDQYELCNVVNKNSVSEKVNLFKDA